MKVGTIDNQVIIYLQGSEDLKALHALLRGSRVRGVPMRKLANALYEANVTPTIDSDGTRTQQMQRLGAEQYTEMVAGFDAQTRIR